jgi:hypothetical protein
MRAFIFSRKGARLMNDHQVRRHHVRLSDQELAVLMEMAQPLMPKDRSEFVAICCQILGRCEFIGAGAIYRVAREVQKRFWIPPDPRPTPKWDRGGESKRVKRARVAAS